MELSNDFSEQLKKIKENRNQFFVFFFGVILVYFLINWLFVHFNSEFIRMGVFLLYFVFAGFFYIKLRNSKCPRCHKFFVERIPRGISFNINCCAHCGLKLD